MEDGLSRADIMNEDGHGRYSDEEVSRAQAITDEGKKTVEQLIAMLEVSARQAGLNKRITDLEREQLAETLHEVFTHEIFKEQQSIIDGD
jgi:hypothetical protein